MKCALFKNYLYPYKEFVMSFDLIIKNGTVILENEARVIDIAVQGGKIAAIGENLGKRKMCWMRRD